MIKVFSMYIYESMVVNGESDRDSMARVRVHDVESGVKYALVVDETICIEASVRPIANNRA